MNSLREVIATIHRLRAPGGCPWDRAQTPQSLRQNLIEETYEVIDTLDQIASLEDLKKPDLQKSFREELGDLLMQILLLSEMASEQGTFTLDDVAHSLNEKLIRRHPHVFGDQKADSEASALKNWEREKAKEKEGDPRASVLDGVPQAIPALLRTSRVLQKVSRVGFQWKELQTPFSKIEEEVQELKEALQAHEKSKKNEASRVHLEAELGDVLFSICNLATLVKISPEDALRTTLLRFEDRFRHVEKKVKAGGKKLEESTLEEMDVFWNEAKKIERGTLSIVSRKRKNPFRVWGLTGGIASGKTLAARFFRELGFTVIDADRIARNLSKKGGAGYEAILQRFGTADRSRLKELVFSDARARKDLEAILHPLIQAESLKQMQEAKSKIILYEAALLVETGGDKGLEGLIVVRAPKEIRLRRLLERDNVSRELGEKIIASQASDKMRDHAATFTLENSGSVEQLKKQIQKLVENFTKI